MIENDILIVDDCPENITFLVSFLEEQGYSVRYAKNAEKAIEAISMKSPTLILLDVVMPEMDGYSLCSLIREKPEYQDFPIIFMSQLDEIENKEKAFMAGGIDYIVKPFNSHELLLKINKQIETYKLTQQLKKEIKLREEIERDFLAFVHSVAHEVKNPIFGIHAKLKSILFDDQSEYVIEQATLKLMSSTTSRCLNLIASLVQMPNISSGNFSVFKKPLLISSFFERFIEERTPDFEQNEITLYYKISEELPEIDADEKALWAIFNNLVDNSIKYNSDNPNKLTIYISVSLIESENGESLFFEIEDNGVGISYLQPQDFSQLFEAYEKSECSNGQGLGLYISKKFVEASGGDMGIKPETRTPTGVCFWFTLPY